MTARAFLVRGLLAGLSPASPPSPSPTVGEPHVERAIAVEEAAAAPAEHSHDGEAAGHSHADEDEGTVVSRGNQRTWGLLTGTLAVGIALGGLVALVSAAVVGRIGRLGPGQSTALVAAVGFVAVGAGAVPEVPRHATRRRQRRHDRRAAPREYFVFLLVSVVAAALAMVLGSRLSVAVRRVRRRARRRRRVPRR